jgi:translation initiation factor IF-2
MAKIRVYELARELNMTNKILLEKIREKDIPIKSHMSSLDEDLVLKIKAHVFGTETEKIEETRVKSTVIRRRRKVVPKEPAPVEEAEAPENAVEAEQSPPAETAPAEPVPEMAPQPGEGEPAVAFAATPEAAATAETGSTQTPAEVPAEETTATVSDESAIAASEVSPSATPESEEASKPAEPPEPEDQAPATPKVTPVSKPKKEKPKRKKETPAKIIQLPVKPKVTAEKPAADNAPGAAASAKAPAAEEPGAAVTDKKKKKWKKKSEEETLNRRFFKKKISFKRKSVIEGADLYAGGKRGRKTRKAAREKPTMGQKTQITTAKAIKRRIKIDDTIILSDLAKRMGIKASEVILKLMGMGVMATVNQIVDYDTAVLVAAEFDYEVDRAAFEEETLLKVETEEDPAKLAERPPVVTIMGHVDHGKTSLLDVIRKTRVTADEAGGITQHIGAYHVTTDKGQIVFLDTPGHEAFTAMRSRGASVTDLVILVVAADDGVMPQTVEAINHSKAANVPIIVAINKIDKADAAPDRVQRELAEHGLTPEDWGGDTIFVPVSAKQDTGIEELLEMIILQSEMLELKANPDKQAIGHVIEAKLDSGRGAVATILVKEGTLRTGDPVVCGVYYGKVRSLLNDRGQQVNVAGPSMPVEVLGLSGVPDAGDELIALADEKDARQVSTHRSQKQRSKELAKTNRVSLEKLFEQMQDGEVKDLNLILKADVHGSTEALRDSLTKLSNEEVNINIIHDATGTITESDVSLAAVSEAIIIGFNVRPSTKVQALATEEQVDIRYYNIIYNVIKDVKDAIVGLMASTYEERALGRAEVRQVFHVPKVGAIAGCYVTDGKIERSQPVRLIRDGIVHYEGVISSLRRYKDDVKEVQSGYECGIGIEKYNDIKVGDEIECFFMEEIKPEVE